MRGVITHPDGTKRETHVGALKNATYDTRSARLAYTSFGTFVTDVNGVFRWICGNDFTLELGAPR